MAVAMRSSVLGEHEEQCDRGPGNAAADAAKVAAGGGIGGRCALFALALARLWCCGGRAVVPWPGGGRVDLRVVLMGLVLLRRLIGVVLGGLLRCCLRRRRLRRGRLQLGCRFPFWETIAPDEVSGQNLARCQHGPKLGITDWPVLLAIATDVPRNGWRLSLSLARRSCCRTCLLHGHDFERTLCSFSTCRTLLLRLFEDF
jgi:hypothetical protein